MSNSKDSQQIGNGLYYYTDYDLRVVFGEDGARMAVELLTLDGRIISRSLNDLLKEQIVAALHEVSVNRKQFCRATRDWVAKRLFARYKNGATKTILDAFIDEMIAEGLLKESSVTECISKNRFLRGWHNFWSDRVVCLTPKVIERVWFGKR